MFVSSWCQTQNYENTYYMQQAAIAKLQTQMSI